MYWILWIVMSCGPGCVAVEAMIFDTKDECLMHQTSQFRCVARKDA